MLTAALRFFKENALVLACARKNIFGRRSVFCARRCDNLGKKQIKFSSSEYFCLDLGNLRNEIQMLSKDIYPKILKSLDRNETFVKIDIKPSQNLAWLQQKLLSLTAIKHGIYDIKTCSLANNYLCSLAFRMVVVSKLFSNVGFNIFDNEKIVLRRTAYGEWVKYLSYANVLSHKISTIKRAFLYKTKENKRYLSILKVSDRLIQMLFVCTYEPVIEYVSDICNYGFRKNRHPHQAIGFLCSKLHRRSKNKQVFNASKYILKYDISQF